VRIYGPGLSWPRKLSANLAAGARLDNSLGAR